MSKALQAITGTERKDAGEESKTEKYDSGTPAVNKKIGRANITCSANNIS